jgi:NAD(P)-dependent dehydrogenase (short-subunit alcohol dehydrogenase family)
METRPVLITGCSSGIGNETARTFRERGWEVYATDPDPSAMADLGDLGCTTAELDVTEAGDAERVVRSIVDDHGRLDCVVNNAGYGQIGPLEELPTERFREQFEVNVFGQQRVLRAALPIMREQGAGRSSTSPASSGGRCSPDRGPTAVRSGRSRG